jgi:hypothetical protein
MRHLRRDQNRTLNSTRIDISRHQEVRHDQEGFFRGDGKVCHTRPKSRGRTLSRTVRVRFRPGLFDPARDIARGANGDAID